MGNIAYYNGKLKNRCSCKVWEILLTLMENYAFPWENLNNNTKFYVNCTFRSRLHPKSKAWFAISVPHFPSDFLASEMKIKQICQMFALLKQFYCSKYVPQNRFFLFVCKNCVKSIPFTITYQSSAQVLYGHLPLLVSDWGVYSTSPVCWISHSVTNKTVDFLQLWTQTFHCHIILFSLKFPIFCTFWLKRGQPPSDAGLIAVIL